MPLEIEALLGAKLPARTGSWDEDDVILYHLGLGAGDPPTAPGELGYVYERGLKVLPSYGVIEASQSLLQLFELPAFDVGLGQILHGEQELELHAPLPTRAEVRTRASVANVYDKRVGALVELETVTSLADGHDLCTNRFGLFVRGEGGFGGLSGPTRKSEKPEREPDHLTEIKTLPQQALIYRLSGDRNPLHADPAFAHKAGFERPILHGLCSFGIALRAAVDQVLDGDVTRVRSYRTRFSGVVFPGETLRVSIWEAPHGLSLTADCPERDGAPVLTDAMVTTN